MKKIFEPIKVTNGIWFYVNKASFDFVVWQTVNGQRQVVEFRVTKKKLEKFMK